MRQRNDAAVNRDEGTLEVVPDHLPPLKAKPPGLLVRVAGTLLDGVAAVTDQVEPYTRWWNDRNQAALDEDGPLTVIVGDSTALGIGASHPANGYIGRLLATLDRETTMAADTPWRAINLAQSGAKLDDGLSRQLPMASKVPGPDLVICCLGTNDLVWGLDTNGLRGKARRLVEGVIALGAPFDRTVACAVAGGSARARLVNRTIRSAAADNGALAANPWNEPGPGPSERLASDKFHPNDLGYTLMARALGRSFGVEAGDAEWRHLAVPVETADTDAGADPESGR
ncbi:MAG: SGNH/GDSL hydrolase family protein [Acidimicrobiia bacterium]|nr:SGNH/GDSL hydrolase family protein [Acidimicrobiia bacterium]